MAAAREGRRKGFGIGQRPPLRGREQSEPSRNRSYRHHNPPTAAAPGPRLPVPESQEGIPPARMSGGGAGGKGAAAPVPAGSRKLVQGLKEIVNRSEAEIYAALRECGMDPDEAVSRLLSQDTFQEVKSKRDKKKEIKEVPESRYRSTNSSANRGLRSGADRGGQINSVHSSSTDNMAPRPPVSGSGTASVNSGQRQTIASSSANKHMVTDGPAATSQSSSGFQHVGWSGTPGQLSMADIVKMGRPQGKASSKPVVTADRGYTGQYPSLPSTVNHSLKQLVSTVSPTELDKGLQPAQDSVQVKNHGHSAADSKLSYGTDWSPQDDPTPANQSSLPEISGDPSLYEASFHQSSTLVTDVVNSHENSHLDENNTIAMRPAPASERHLESEYNDGILNNSSSYQPHNYSYTEQEVEDSSADVSAAAAANFQSLSLHNDELAAKNIAEDNPAVIIPDHLQVTNTECVSLSFGSFGSGAFSGLFPQKANDSSVEFPAREESAPVDQIDARNQDYYESGAVNSPADENLEVMLGADMENVDTPSVSQANELRPDELDSSGLQYAMPSVSSHAYSSMNTSQPSTMEEPQGNNQAHTLSHLSNLMQANPLSTSSLLGSNQNHSTLHSLDFGLPYMESKYNTGSTTNPRPAISMQEALKAGVFSSTQSTQSLPSTTIPTGPPLPQQLAPHPYSQPTVPITHFPNMVGYPTYLPQNYATYLSSGAFQQAYPSNGPFHQSAAAALLGSGMKYSTPEYKNNLPATGLQQQQQQPQPPSSVISGYGGFGSSSNMQGNFALNQSTGSASTLGFDEALSRQYKDTSQYMALQQGDNSAMWLHGSGSRAASTVPPNHFYGYQGQSQLGGFRQAQQPQPSQFGGHGYSAFYQSQGGLTQEHPQNLAEGSLNGFQAAPSQPSHPSWQHQHTY